MKKGIQLLVLAALATMLALPAFAQATPATSSTSTAAAGAQDGAEAKAALYKKFTDNRVNTPDVAYEAGKEYLAKYEATDGAEDQYVKYIKKWVASYEKIARRSQLIKQLDAKDYNTAFASSKQVLVDFPDDLALLYELSKAGLFAAEANNTTNNADAVNYAKQTIARIQAGKTFEKDKPIPNKDEIIGGLNYAIGFLLSKTQPAEALNYFVSATQYEGFAKKDPRTYLLVGEIYNNDYSTLATQYSTNCKTDDQIKSQTCVDLKTKVDQLVDHMIDALARAIAYNDASPTAAANASARASWMDTLTKYYKYRNPEGSDAALKALIASITSKPMPKPTDQITPATPSTPSSSAAPVQPGSMTPAAATTGAATTSKSSTTTSKSATTSKSSTTTTTQQNGKSTTSQPTGKTSSSKTTPKRAHISGRQQ